MSQKITTACLFMFLGFFVSPLFVRAATVNPGTFNVRSVYDATDGQSYNYQVFLPVGYTPSQTYPVVIFLHGSGESGNDNIQQISVGLGPVLKANPSLFPAPGAIVIFPQMPKVFCRDNPPPGCVNPPATKVGASVAGDTRLVLEALVQTQTEFKTDQKRIYLTGLSLGGFLDWDIAYENPNLFAAVIPFSGDIVPDFITGTSGSTLTQVLPSVIARLNNLPIWMEIGSTDTRVSVPDNRTIYQAFLNAGAPIKYIEQQGYGHGGWEIWYNDSNLWNWAFSKSRTGAVVIPPTTIVPPPTQTPPITPATPITPTTPSTSCLNWHVSLSVGSTGLNVVLLQNFLIAKGYLAAGNNTGYFGDATRVAVKAFQTANGISPEGDMGLLTRAKIKALTCVEPAIIPNPVVVPVTPGVTAPVTDSGAIPLPTLAPTVTLSASPMSIVAGQSSILTWTSTNAVSCTITGGLWDNASIDKNHSLTISLTQTNTYTVTCINTAGLATKSVTITVTPAGTTDTAGSGSEHSSSTTPTTHDVAFVPSFTYSCPSRQCTLYASGSTSANTIIKYAWAWGDGRSESHTVPAVKNTWSTAGTYTVTLTETDSNGLSASVSQQVIVPANSPTASSVDVYSQVANVLDSIQQLINQLRGL